MLALGLLVSSVNAQDKPDLTNPKQKTSYAIGVDAATSLKDRDIDLDPKALAAGISDTLAGKPALKQQEVDDTLSKLRQELQAKAEAKDKVDGEKNQDKVESEKNLKAGKAFLAANAKKDGVITTATGLQYKVLKSGTGASPQKTDTVKVQYRGMSIDGTVFDSSEQRGGPITFPVSGMIPSWTEALQLMKVGDKWLLFSPANLAYGERSLGPMIGPNSTLLFEVELLGIEK